MLVQPASAGFYGEAEEMARTKGFPFLRRMSLRNPYFAAISAEIERQWLALGVPRERMFRMASGVDADHFHPAADRTIESGGSNRSVIFTGRLHPQKNLDVLLEIWPEVTMETGAEAGARGRGSGAGAAEGTRWCSRRGRSGECSSVGLMIRRKRFGRRRCLCCRVWRRG